ncbi:DUF3226 domain-containing protein [Campylobacter lari]|uniref:DUF3226 domain-containing protein n=1 Tax=Campylobacter lari TaxID=201 RepID=UPI001309BF57|nr:DUF3226 domain-containing protein [Campylobacter lari]MBT0821662.1 hypothetical protein [Campylobacter lari]MBT0829729.1 hypothetical protein [Campylobacter lari]
MKINIFVEGKHDKEFLEQYLNFLKLPNANIIPCGKNHLDEDAISKMEEAKDNNEKILLIFDTDKNFNSTLERIKKESKDLLQDENIFLFPNNFENGELETLLFAIAKEAQICQCFENYKKCIEKLNPQYSKNIHKKSARFAYFEALGFFPSNDEKAKKARKNSYAEIFDFNHIALEPLKDFLIKHYIGYCK